MSFLALLMVVAPLSSLLAPAAAQDRLRCPDRCGNVTIPYPFGLAGCNRSPEFLITCNYSFSPPVTFLRTSNIKVTNINLDGKLEISRLVSRDCYNKSGIRNPVGFRRRLLSLSNFTISKSQNKFTVIGCDSYGYIKGFRDGKLYSSGCMSLCAEREFVDEDSCSGSGCCQIEIPDGLYYANVTAYSFNNHTNVSDFNLCTYAFVVEDGKFNFSFKYIDNISNTTEFPVVLDWAIQENSTSACKEHAQSYKPHKVPGHLCKCKAGYQGNPYVGCQDINECENEHQCTDKCTNRDGNYTCSCPKGYHGDGRKDGQGCTRNQLSLVKIILSIGIGFTALVVAASWLYLIFRKRKLIQLKEKFFRQNGGAVLQQKLSRREGTPDTAKIFTAEELKKATRNYDETTIIGKGGFGTVYKGILTDNRIVAIKKSITIDQNQIDQFINEVVVLSQINHKNVVRLLGCCLETPVPLLVYEFITNGTLFDHIHNESNGLSALSWQIRLKIAAETAGALSYLHSAASVPIIHRDVKTTNILLDADYTAKVSDFGASRLAPMDEAQLSTVVQGTWGYLDPEYLHTNQLTDKSDVYSFGVILVELLTSMKALCFDRPEEERSLAMFFLSSMKGGKLFEVVDCRIINQGTEEQIKEVARLAARCLRLKGEERPSMKEVAMELEGLRMMEVHTWDAENPEETELLLSEKNKDFGHGDSTNASAAYDSIQSHANLSLGDGR